MKPVPPVTPETAPWWAGCARGELLLQRCAACGHKQHYPRQLCAACGHRELVWEAASGRGRIRSYTVIRRAVSAAFAEDTPYVVALIELEEGPTLMTNLLHCDPEALAIGQPVRALFEARGPAPGASPEDTVFIPQFQPDN